MNGDISYHSDKRVDGEFDNGIWWIDGDHGSWDGPSQDWITSHRDKIIGRVREFGVAVQAGGNLGLYPRLLASRFERVYTFEPHPLAFRTLAKNVEPLMNVVAINAALGDKNGLCSMSFDFSDNMGTNQTLFDESRGMVYPMFTVDQLCLDRCDLIWFDIERYEEFAVKGSLKTIERFHPTIALETVNDEINRVLGDLGYEMVDRSVTDAVLIHKDYR